MTDTTSVAPEVQSNAPVGMDTGAPAPAAAPAEQAPVSPLLDRSVLQPSPSDAHLEGEQLPEHLQRAKDYADNYNKNPQKDQAEAPAEDTPVDDTPLTVDDVKTETLADMIGKELMQDPASRLVSQSLIRLLGDADHNRAFAQAIAEGDSRFIDEAYLREQLGDNAEEAIQAAKYLLDCAENYAENLQAKLYESVPGGEQAVQLAARHFKETATPAEQKMIAHLLDSGDFELMQSAINSMVERASAVIPKGGQQTHVTQAAVQPLTREEFGRKILENPNMSETQYAQLRTRLAAGMQR